jgi:hypothetical protein
MDTGASALPAKKSGNNQAANNVAAQETNVAVLQKMFVASEAWETNGQEEETAATRRQRSRRRTLTWGNGQLHSTD